MGQQIVPATVSNAILLQLTDRAFHEIERFAGLGGVNKTSFTRSRDFTYRVRYFALPANPSLPERHANADQSMLSSSSLQYTLTHNVHVLHVLRILRNHERCYHDLLFHASR
jgi:hypothetical protein